MAFLPTNASQVQQFAVAVYGIKVGTATMAAVQADITAVGGLNNALNSYFATSFGATPTATVAASIAANLGLTAATGLADVTAYIDAQLKAAPANARGEVISSILNLFSTLSSNAVIGTAVTAWNTKVAAAVSYTGAADAAVASGASVDGQAFTLTVDVEDVAGTAGNDTINALSANTDSTLNAGDLIDGGAGNDTLKISVTVDGEQGNAFETANVENVQIRALATGDNFDATLWDGVEVLTSLRSTATVEVDNIQNNVVLEALRTAADLTVEFADDALGSDAATITLNVESADDIAVAVTVGGDDAVTAYTIAATGDNVVDIVGTGVETLTLTGSGTLELTATGDFDELTSVDASANKGGVTLDVSTADALASLKGSASDDVITVGTVDTDATIDLGAGDDILTAAAGSFADALKVDGGAGKDSIQTQNITVGTASLFYNFETFDVTGQTADTAVDASLLTNSTIGAVGVSGAINAGVVVSNVGLGSTIEVYGTTDLGGGDLRVNYAGATGTTDATTLNFTTVVAAANNFDDVRLDAIETLNISSGGTVTTNVIAELISNAVVTINVTGDQDFTLSDLTNVTAGGVTTFKTLDASKATGVQTIVLPDLVADQTDAVAVAVSYTVKLGEGDDSLTLVAADATDNKATTANVDLSAGGDDSIVVTGFVSDTASVAGGTVGSMVVITGIDAGDTITFDDTAMDDTWGDDIDVSAATSFADAINTAMATANADVSWFLYGGNTYLVADVNDDGAYTTVDTVVKLVGEYDLSTATIANSVVTFA